MKIFYFMWNYLVPNLFKNFIKKIFLIYKYKNIKLSKWTISKISLIDLINKKIILNKNISLYETSVRWNFKIWEYSYVNWPNTNFVSLWKYKIEIWRYCCIAMNTNLITYNDHLNNKLTNYPFEKYSYLHTWGDIIIWNDVWIWMNTIILPWVKIWNWVVIWAWTVVTNNIPNYAIYAWNPWKIIKYRFDEITIEKLLKLERWNWDIEKVKNNYNLDFLNKNSNE
jgi:acetyltransferase-like isoleucine patch superfamily enzyme